MSPENRVTICVPCFNNESTLRETIESILNQSHKQLVIKIFDNASTDQTLKVAKEIAEGDPRVKVVSNSTNIGAEGNFNLCLAAAEGDFTAIFHADDVYEPSMIDAQVRFLTAHPECSAVATQASIIDQFGTKHGVRFLPSELKRRREASLSFKELFQLTLEFGNFITCPSVMARSATYRDVVRIWDGGTFGSSADLDVWLRLAQAGQFGILTSPLMRYRVSEASFTVRETKRRFTEHDLLKVYRSYLSSARTETAREKLRYLRFHEFKDVAARRLNILQAGQHEVAFPQFSGGLLSLLPTLFKSRYHFKFLTASFAIFSVTGLMKLMGLHK